VKRWLAAVPAAALAGLAGLGLFQLLNPEKTGFERAARAAPQTDFPTLDGGRLRFAPPPSGKPVIVNLFASWCGPCEAEHPYLTALSARYPGQVYGVLYKDTPENGTAFLSALGNPYTEVALDAGGAGGLDFGLTGVPETFVISAAGEIQLHIAGPLDDASAQKISEALAETPR
jgi:cytochrome c biogenesis protein CcmG, thiol:disulfide interchange protein DsbE